MKLKDVFISYEEFKRDRYDDNKQLLLEVINKEYDANDFVPIDIGNDDNLDAHKSIKYYNIIKDVDFYAEISIMIRLFADINSFIYKSTFKRGKNIRMSISINSYKITRRVKKSKFPKKSKLPDVKLAYLIKFQFRNSNISFAKDIYHDDEYFKYMINRLKEHIVFLNKSNNEQLNNLIQSTKKIK